MLGAEYIESRLSSSYPDVGAKIKDAWLEYEAGTTVEARFVKEMDKFECLLQAHEYEQITFGEKDLEEFQGLDSKINSPHGRKLTELLKYERKAHFAKRRQRTPVIFVIGMAFLRLFPFRTTIPFFVLVDWEHRAKSYTNSVVGGTTVNREIQCGLLRKEFGFQSITLEEVLRERADDSTLQYARIARRYLEADVEVPVQLAVELLEGKINARLQEGMNWTLVRGFPVNMPHLTEFREKVSFGCLR
jgi:putative hydrolase of HD superfamily